MLIRMKKQSMCISCMVMNLNMNLKNFVYVCVWHAMRFSYLYNKIGPILFDSDHMLPNDMDLDVFQKIHVH